MTDIPGVTDGLSDAQVIGVLPVPTLYINQFSIMVTNEAVKLVFLERASGSVATAAPRCAVAMSHNAAVALRDMLTEYVEHATKDTKDQS